MSQIALLISAQLLDCVSCAASSNTFAAKIQTTLRYEGDSGKKKQIRMIRCKTCMSRFSERNKLSVPLKTDKPARVILYITENRTQKSFPSLRLLFLDSLLAITEKLEEHHITIGTSELGLKAHPFIEKVVL